MRNYIPIDFSKETIIKFGHGLMFAAALSLTACGNAPKAIDKVNTGVQNVTDKFLTDVTGILNASEPDLKNAALSVSTIVPSTGKPLNAPLADCINKGVLTVKADVVAVVAGSHGAGAGAITVAAVAGSMQPGSTFYEGEKKLLLDSCAAVAVNMGLDVLTNLGQIVPALAAPIAAAAPLGA